jgi:hypothetical protein
VQRGASREAIRLSDILNKRTVPRTSKDVPMSREQLLEIAECRRRDRQEFLNVLEESKYRTFEGEEEWMDEFLQLEGNEIINLAELLVNQKCDSP